MNDSAANPDIAGQIACLQRIVEGVAARIANQRVIGGSIVVLTAELVNVGDIFKLARAIRSLAREGPIA